MEEGWRLGKQGLEHWPNKRKRRSELEWKTIWWKWNLWAWQLLYKPWGRRVTVTGDPKTPRLWARVLWACPSPQTVVTQNHSQFSGLACLSVWTSVTCLILKEMLGNVSLKALIRITPTEPMWRRSGVISSWMPSWYPHLPASPRPGSVSGPCTLRTSWEVSDQSMVCSQMTYLSLTPASGV